MRFAMITALAFWMLEGCGGKAIVDPPLIDDEPALPPLPAVCQAGVDAIDWTECDTALSELKDITGVNCARAVDTAGCETETETFWLCVADAEPICKITGPNTTSWATPDCEDETDALSECLMSCGAGYTCQEEGGVDCTCSGSTAFGEACRAFPNLDPSLPLCPVLCSPCG